MVELTLSQAEIQEALRIGERRYERHKHHKNPRYRNLPRTHLHGALGEIAFRRWLDRVGIAYHVPCLALEEDTALPDFLCHSRADELPIGIEVKTWEERYWEAWGRCIAVEQLPYLQKKGVHLIVWATVALEWHRRPSSWDDIREQLGELQSLPMILRGWHPIEEVKSWGLPRYTGPEGQKVLNYQAPDAGRDLSELRALLIGG